MRSSQQSRAGRRWQLPRAKTAVPRVPANFVSRDELRTRLEVQSAEFPITLLCAPAGYGKTLLLANWVEKTGAGNKAWVSLDGSDDDAARFWTAVLDAVCGCAHVHSASLLSRLRPPAAPDNAGFLAEVIDAVAALPAPLYLVLDDLQEVQHEQTWHGIAMLVRHQPGNLRLVLSTRADPPLPLARLRVHGALAELRAHELRFSTEHAAELLRLADVGLDEDQVRRLVAQTEGWPAGLRLAARSLRDVADREAFLNEFAGNDRSLADFLVGEVLDRLPTATIEVLTLVSVCDEVTPTLAAVLTGRADAGAVLAGLERDNSLMLGVGPNRQWFRMHPLLRSYLLADLARRRPGVVADLHEKAALWFAAQEQPDKAFDHVTLTGEHHATVDLLHRHAATVLLTGDDHHFVRRALTKIGAEAVAGSPRLALASALAHMAADDRALAEADLATCWAAWPADPDAELILLRQLVLTTQALSCGRAPPVATLDWSNVIAAYEGADLEAWARLGLGWTLLCAGERIPARRELEVAERLAREHGFDYVTMHCRSALGALFGQDGEFPAMESAGAAALEIAYAHGWTASPWLSADHLMIGLARLFRLEPTTALDAAWYAAIALPTDTDVHVLRYLIDMLTGAAYVDLGCPQKGLPWLQRARHDHEGGTVPAPLLAAGALIELRCTLDLGHDTLAQQLTAWTRARVGDIAEPRLMQAWTALAHGELRSADMALHDVLDGRCPARSPTTRLETRLLETALAIHMGRRTRARDALNAALVLAEPMSLIRPFRCTDVSVRHLLQELVGSFGRTNGFATRVSRAVSTTDTHAVDMLTSREHAVLVRLSSLQSLDELASDLSVSVNTVKTHVRAIYAKLGVNNRRAAVVASRQLGLGSP